jgi:hypothetical protein
MPVQPPFATVDEARAAFKAGRDELVNYALCGDKDLLQEILNRHPILKQATGPHFFNDFDFLCYVRGASAKNTSTTLAKDPTKVVTAACGMGLLVEQLEHTIFWRNLKHHTELRELLLAAQEAWHYSFLPSKPAGGLWWSAHQGKQAALQMTSQDLHAAIVEASQSVPSQVVPETQPEALFKSQENIAAGSVGSQPHPEHPDSSTVLSSIPPPGSGPESDSQAGKLNPSTSQTSSALQPEPDLEGASQVPGDPTNMVLGPSYVSVMQDPQTESAATAGTQESVLSEAEQGPTKPSHTGPAAGDPSSHRQPGSAPADTMTSGNKQGKQKMRLEVVLPLPPSAHPPARPSRSAALARGSSEQPGPSSHGDKATGKRKSSGLGAPSPKRSKRASRRLPTPKSDSDDEDMLESEDSSSSPNAVAAPETGMPGSPVQGQAATSVTPTTADVEMTYAPAQQPRTNVTRSSSLSATESDDQPKMEPVEPDLGMTPQITSPAAVEAPSTAPTEMDRYSGVSYVFCSQAEGFNADGSRSSEPLPAKYFVNGQFFQRWDTLPIVSRLPSWARSPHHLNLYFVHHLMGQLAAFRDNDNFEDSDEEIDQKLTYMKARYPALLTKLFTLRLELARDVIEQWELAFFRNKSSRDSFLLSVLPQMFITLKVNQFT